MLTKHLSWYDNYNYYFAILYKVVTACFSPVGQNVYLVKDRVPFKNFAF